jgi:hypothetical protein
MSEDIYQLAKKLSDEYQAKLDKDNPIAGPWKNALFVCPDCATEIIIKTRLEFIHPFRIACPCKYSGMHKASPWVIEGYE